MTEKDATLLGMKFDNKLNLRNIYFVCLSLHNQPAFCKRLITKIPMCFCFAITVFLYDTFIQQNCLKTIENQEKEPGEFYLKFQFYIDCKLSKSKLLCDYLKKFRLKNNSVGSIFASLLVRPVKSCVAVCRKECR